MRQKSMEKPLDYLVTLCIFVMKEYNISYEELLRMPSSAFDEIIETNEEFNKASKIDDLKSKTLR